MSKKVKNKLHMQIKETNQLLILFVLVSFLFSCGEETKVIPDISDISVEVDFVRFDQQFQAIDTTDTQNSLGQLETKYPIFTPLFYKRILPLLDQGQPNNKALLADNINKYINDPFVQSLYDTVQIVYPQLDDIQASFEESARYLKYYFPEKGNYRVYAFISEFGYQTFITDDSSNKEGLGLGLDMFLGQDYPYKAMILKNPTFSDYITRTFNKEHIVKKLMDAIIFDLANVNMGERLLDKMVSNGIKQYVLDRVLPYTPDSIKWEYTSAQMDWVEKNEENIYVHVLGEDLLYSTRTKLIKSLVDKSPSSKGMPPEAPGRTANYIGYKIVDKFMARSKISMDSLVRIKDAQFILDNSRYKPLNKSR